MEPPKVEMVSLLSVALSRGLDYRILSAVALMRCVWNDVDSLVVMLDVYPEHKIDALLEDYWEYFGEVKARLESEKEQTWPGSVEPQKFSNPRASVSTFIHARIRRIDLDA